MNDVALRRGFRPEIQGLRAVAVLLVVAYHLYPNRISGGYVGVDVFFVLSGYLITSHLVREASTTERLSLTRFWARRIRRLLPASLLVLAVSAVLTWIWVPRSLWDQTLHQLTASALYVENWALAGDAVDYSAAGNTPTLVQHYWSLSVEEQFYLVWPLLVAGAVLLVRGRRLPLRTALAATFGVVALLSFAYSVMATADDPARAYFVTPTRAWEFAVGALVALAAARVEPWWTGHEPVRVVLGWAGLAAVLAAGLTLDDASAFPGAVAAVPVLGTAAVVLAGGGRSPWAVAGPLSWRPMTFVGDISYSVYLWHWPFIVVLPFVTGVDLRTRDKVGIFVVTLVVSWACTRWVEDPLRTTRFLADVPWRAYALGAAGMVVVVAAAGVLRADLDRDIAAAQATAARAVDQAMAGNAPCLGPSALHHRARCGPVAGDGNPPLDPAAVARQNVDVTYPGCMSALDETQVRTCELGARRGVRRTVALVGDSHATAWFSAFDVLARQRHWRVVTYTRSSCPLTDARRTLPDEPAQRYRNCRAGNTEIEQRLLDDPDVDTVFVTAFSSAYGWAQGEGTTLADPATDGFRAVWRRLTDAGKQVVVVRDVPGVKDKINTPDCLAAHPGKPLECATTRSEGLLRDVEADAVDGAPRGVRLVDLTDEFCDARHCYAVVGDVIVYRDYSHLSKEYSTLLAPALGRAIDAVDDPLR